MKSYVKPKFKKSTLTHNKSKQGERLETKVERMVHNKEPIKDGAPLMYTQRNEGVKESTNIRTDRWEVAVDGATKITKSFTAKRAEKNKPTEEKEDGKPKSIQGEPAKGADTQQSSQ